MTVSLPNLLFDPVRATEAAVWGAQRPLVVAEAPSGAEATIGKPLIGLTLSVDGAYVCLLDIAGLASLVNVNVLPQLTTATLTSAGPDELASFDPRAVNVADAEVITAGTGDGALTDDTLQLATLTPTGARYARYTLTVASAGSLTFDVAEYGGK